MSDYIDGRLADSAVGEFEAHIEDCVSCRHGLEATSRLVDDLASLRRTGSPVDCWQVIRSRIRDASLREPFWRRWNVRPVIAVPAAGIACALAAFLAWPGVVGDDSGLSSQEYRHYLAAHSSVQTQQALSDPDVTFFAAELESDQLRKPSSQ